MCILAAHWACLVGWRRCRLWRAGYCGAELHSKESQTALVEKGEANLQGGPAASAHLRLHVVARLVF